MSNPLENLKKLKQSMESMEKAGQGNPVAGATYDKETKTSTIHYGKMPGEVKSKEPAHTLDYSTMKAPKPQRDDRALHTKIQNQRREMNSGGVIRKADISKLKEKLRAEQTDNINAGSVLQTEKWKAEAKKVPHGEPIVSTPADSTKTVISKIKQLFAKACGPLEKSEDADAQYVKVHGHGEVYHRISDIRDTGIRADGEKGGNLYFSPTLPKEGVSQYKVHDIAFGDELKPHQKAKVGE